MYREDMRTVMRTILLGAMPLLGGCRPPAAAPPATPAAQSATAIGARTAGPAPVVLLPLALPDFRAASRDAAAQARLAGHQVAALPQLHRLRTLERCLVKFTHFIYEEDDFGPDDVFRREGWMVLLGTRDGRTLGLTTRCAVDVHQPGYQYLDASEPGDPELVAGVLALQAPGTDGCEARHFAHALVEHETDWNHALLRRPYGRFLEEFCAPAQLSHDAWSTLVERGTRVTVKPVGKHDLALVVFEHQKQLGVDAEPFGDERGGLRITSVWPGSAAARAGLETGDRLLRIGRRDCESLGVLQQIMATAPCGEAISVAYERAGTLGTGTRSTAVTFAAPDELTDRGAAETFGINAPMSAVADLLQSLQTVGDLLQSEMTAQCSRCRERAQRADVSGAPTLADALARLVPIAGGLLALDGEAIADRAAGVGGVVDAINEWRRLLSGVDDLRAFLREFPMGDPILLDPATLQLERGDRFSAAPAGGGARQAFRLAYIESREPQGLALLERTIRMARHTQRALLAVPDGRDIGSGCTHVHLLVADASQLPPNGWRAGAGLVLEGYVNLVMIREGAATAADHGVSDGRTTRVVLDAFRRLDSLDR